MVVPPCLQGRIWDAEQLPSCQQFIGNATQGILVTLWAGQPLKLFRGHVWGRPTGANEPGTDARQEYRNTEVGQHYITFLIEKNVFRFEVTMHNRRLVLVGVVQSLPYLRQDNKGFVDKQWLTIAFAKTITQ